jgi:serine/threonine protein kinase
VTPPVITAGPEEGLKPAPDEWAWEDSYLAGGRYRLGPILGYGSEAVVRKALDTHTGSTVAAKIFRSDAAHSGERFHREVSIHRRLNHWAIVPMTDYGRMDSPAGAADRTFMVMEYVEGWNLRHMLQRGPADPAMTAAWIGSILHALAHVHRKGIVHNDIKPANILIPSRGNERSSALAKLTDFGIATSRRHAPLASISGTAHYMSPEEVHGTEATEASDIYSLGLVALECLTGAKPFPGSPVETMVARTLNKPRIPYTLGRRWTVLLQAMTESRPAERPTARQALRMLHRINR